MNSLNVINPTIRSGIGLLLLTLLLGGCGPDSGYGSSSGTGTSGAAVSQGVVAAKGSIFVNGIEYDTTYSNVMIDDSPSTADLLKVGMTVKVRGSSDDVTKRGTASDVVARDALEGTISAVGANTITVMGQTVQIEDNVTRLNDDDTVKLFSAAGFAVGNIVEVNGYADDNGGLLATRVAKKTSGEFEVKGFVTGLTASTFGLSRIAGGAPFLTVNFSAGQLPAGVVTGSLVQVKSVAAPSGGGVTASLIKLEDSLGSSGEKAEVEGIVTSGTLADFVVNGQRVVTDASTVFEGGLSSDFAVGAKLEAEGQLNSSGAIAASKISFRSNIKIEGDATAVTAAGLTVLGKFVIINQFTRVDNGPVVDASHVEVRAKLDRDGNLIATRVKVLSPSSKAFLQGTVSAADGTAGTLTILGTSLFSDGSTEWRVSSTPSDLPVGKAEFLAQLKTNISVVKVKWNSFVAISDPVKEAEIELGK
jgi:hypothetical protein